MSMLCPICGSKAKIFDSRPSKDSCTRRRYKCAIDDKHRWSTVEMVVSYRSRSPHPLKAILEAKMQDVGRQKMKEEIATLLGLNTGTD